jgi:hypothetical protein
VSRRLIPVVLIPPSCSLVPVVLIAVVLIAVATPVVVILEVPAPFAGPKDLTVNRLQ